MTTHSGQALRRTGLVIEVLAMAGLVARSRGVGAFWERLPFDPTTLLGGLFALGFGLWLTGTFKILSARKQGLGGEGPGRD